MYGSNVFRLAERSSVRYYKNGSTKKLLEFLADMPKVNSARIAEAQHQRQNISKKGEKYGPSTVYLQVLGSGARGVPNTLYLFTDQKRYLFNCGECTQRLAHEHKVKLSRLEHVFITSKTWKNIGGLPGLSLTLQDVGLPKITLHGPEGLDELYNATKRFIIMKDMRVTMAPSSPAVDFEDSVMTIKYVHLSSQPTLGTLLEEIPNPCKRPRLDVASPELNQFAHDKTDYYQRDTSRDSATGTEDKKSLKPRSAKSPERKDKKKTLQADLNGNYSVAYICTLKKRLGTLDLAKCVEKGVPPGPLLGQLKAGHDVVLPDGTLVLSKTVKTPDDPGPVFIVLELPDISYLSESEFAAHFDDGINPPESIPTLIVHMSPPEVFNNDRYKAFIAKFGQKTQHLIVNADNRCLGSEAVHRTQHKLHLLDPEVFPLLKDQSIPAEWSVHKPMPKTNCIAKMKGFEDLKNRIALAQFQNILNSEKPQQPEAGGAQPETHSSRTLTMFHLRPKRQIDRSAEPKLQIQEYYQETMDVDGFVHSLEKFRGVVQDVRYAKNASNKDYPKLVFLGTGSCIPSKTRNTSAILVQIDPQNTILLDCGEGTFGQLVRFCGPRKVDDLLRTLKAIYISHLHADHHIGLIGMLQARAAAFAETPEKNAPLLLLAPGQIATWLSMYDTQFENIANEFTLVPNQNLTEESKEAGLTPALLAGMGLVEVRTCLVPHCPNAFAAALTAGAHKITYSGDTLPTEKLVELGKNSTILIHEATMEDELAEEARIKMHSTTSQAIEIGRKMNAKHTILTHFSQRYARLPRLNAHILNDNNTVGIAFDNMQVTLGDLPLLPHMYAPLQLMFAEHCVDMELKAASRERRKANSAGKDMETSPRSPRDRSKTDFSGKGSADTARVKQIKSKKSDSIKPKILLPRGRGDLVKNHPMSNMKIVQKPVVQRLCLKDRKSQQPSKSGTAMRPRATSVLLATSNELRYKENITSRLRRKQSSSLNTSTTTILSDHKINIETLVATRTPPHTTPSSKSVTPQSIRSPRATTPSPTPPPYRSSDDNKRMAKRTAYPKPNPYRPSDCKTYVMVKSNKEGYGQPLLKSSLKKLVIRPYPSPVIPRKPITETVTEVTLLPGGGNVLRERRARRGEEAPGPRSGAGLQRFEILETAQSCESGSMNVGNPRANSVKAVCGRTSNTQTDKKGGARCCSVTKNYTPVLSDIESSFYILTKGHEENIQSDDGSLWEQNPKASEIKDEIRPVLLEPRVSFLRLPRDSSVTKPTKKFVIRKPDPVNEDLRQALLREAKAKFLSKEYLFESKYEKIEGLNWITWKS